ncbi:MAG: SPFH domain-containing protein, partial [Comamonas sp.]|nr:SPFH domain-containing protein [Comamonas sp.]
TDQNFRIDEFADTMRSRIVSVFTEALAKAQVPVLDVATRYGDLGQALAQIINPAMVEKYGIEVTSFVLENVSVPPEVEQAIDKRSSMGAIGNLNDYVKYQMGQAMASGGEGAAAATMPATMAMGFGMAQEMMRQMQQPGTTPGAQPGLGAPAGHDAFSPAAAQAAQAAQAAAQATPAGTAPALQVYTPEQAAQLLGVDVADVLAELEAGQLKGRKIGANWRIAQAALDEFLRGA